VTLYPLDPVESDSLSDRAAAREVPVTLMVSVRRSSVVHTRACDRTSRRYLEYEIAFEV